MPATIGEHSFFETLLGLKTIEKLDNHAAFMVSAIQQDLTTVKSKQYILDVQHGPTLPKPTLEILYRLRGDFVKEEVFLLLHQFFPKMMGNMEQANEKHRVVPYIVDGGLTVHSYLFEIGGTQVIVGLKLKLQNALQEISPAPVAPAPAAAAATVA